MSLEQQQAEEELERTIATLRRKLAEQRRAPVAASSDPLSDQPGLPPIDASKLEYRLKELTSIDSEFFLQHLCRCLLKREPYQSDVDNYGGALKSGAVNKADLAFIIARSGEASARGINLRADLLSRLRHRLAGVPIVGRLVTHWASLVQLGRATGDQRRDHYLLLSLRRSMVDTVDRTTSLERSLNGLAVTMRSLDSQRAANGAAVGLRTGETGWLWARLDELTEKLKRAEEELAEHRAELARLKDEAYPARCIDDSRGDAGRRGEVVRWAGRGAELRQCGDGSDPDSSRRANLRND